MFTEIFNQLKESHTFCSEILRKRLDAAITKKLGVINLPYHFWCADKKINPLTEHLLWASILLEDQGKFSLIEGIIIIEYKESLKSKTSNKPTEETIQNVLEKTVANYVNHLLAFFTDDGLQEEVTRKIQATLSGKTYEKRYVFDKDKKVRMLTD